MHHLWKGKIAPHLCHSHRAILISSTMGKAVHRTIRGLGMGPFRNVHSPLQVGGMPRHPVLIAAHAARLFASMNRRSSCFLLLLDLREAFYRVARPLLVGADHSAESAAKVFQQLHLPPESFQAFCASLSEESAVRRTGASAWMQSVFRELLTDTWFRLPQQSDVIATELGTRPGDCLADLMFSYLFAVVLGQVQQSLLTEGFDLSLPWDDRMRGAVCQVSADASSSKVLVADCTWMDDMCLMVRAPGPDGLISQLSFAAGVLIDTCISHGMMPNLEHGKTEAIVMLHGTGARDVKRRHLACTEPSVAVGSKLWDNARVRVTPVYKHLGGLLTHQAKLDREVRARIGLAWAAFNKHKKQVFASPVVPVLDKVSIFTSVVLSVLLYGAGSWTGVDVSVTQRLEKAYVAMARMMWQKHMAPDSPRISGARVLAMLELPSVALQLHTARLSYLASFVRLDIPCLWALAHAEGTWLEHVASSLQWLWSEVDNQRFHPSWQDAWETWRADLPHKPRWWKRLIRFAKESAGRKERLAEAWQFYRGSVLRCLMRAGAALPGVPEVQRLPVEVCAPCCKCFDTKQAWAVHAFKTHGKVRKERTLVEGLTCPICLKTYASNIRLCRHVQHSATCKVRLLAEGYAATVAPGVGNKRAGREEDLLRPAMQGYGPLREQYMAGEDVGIMHPECRWAERCSDTLSELHALVAAEQALLHLSGLMEAARSILCRRCISSSGLVDTVNAWRESVQHLPEDACSLRWGALLSACTEWVCDNICVSWLCQMPSEVISPTVHTFEHSEAALAWLDFAWVEDKPLCMAEGQHGLLLCHDKWQHIFVDSHSSWALCHSTAQALQEPQWRRDGMELLSQGCRGLFCLCLLGHPRDVTEVSSPVKAKTARAALELINLIREIVEFCLTLWDRRHPFVAVIPCVDSAFLSTLLAVPGIEGFRSEGWQVLHNVPEHEVPETLFHHV